MSCFVRNPEDRFCRNEAHVMLYLLHACTANYMHVQLSSGTRSIPFSTSKLSVCER